MSDDESIDAKSVFDISENVLSGITTFNQLHRRHPDIDLGLLAKLCDTQNPIKTPYMLAATLLALANPNTHPSLGPDYPISISLLTDILIVRAYDLLRHYLGKDVLLKTRRLDMTVYMFEIAVKALKLLNMYPTVDYTTIENSPETWKDELDLWVPKEEVREKLHILYPVCCIVLLAIHKLYLNENLEPNLAYSPYLEFFCRLWNSATGIVILGLEIDRRLETEENQLSPDIVIETLRGASAIRYVLAYILNSNPCSGEKQTYDHDLRKLSIEDFMSVLRRQALNGGSLQQEFDCFAFSSSLAMVSSQDPLTMIEEDPANPGNIQGLQAVDVEDRYDEDLNYIFDSDSDSLELEQLNDEDNQEDWLDDEFDDANDDNETELTNEELHKDGNKQLDWKDIPRGYNAEITEEFKIVLEQRNPDLFYRLDQDLYDHVLAENNPTDGASQPEAKKERSKFLNTLAAAIYQPGFMDINMGDFIDFLFSPVMKADPLLVLRLTSVVPINGLCHFEILIHIDPDFAFCLFDELLMTPNKRRNLIWLLCDRINLSHGPINYVFELLTKRRGTQGNNAYPFSRKGPLVLSEVEELMLIHEFLSGASRYVGSTAGINVGGGVEIALAETVANKLVTMLCLMINRLVDQGVITIKTYDDENDIRDYTTSIKNFAIDWIAKNKDARELFFRLEQSKGSLDSKDDKYLEKLNENETKCMRRIIHVLLDEGYFGIVPPEDRSKYQNLGLMELSKHIDEFRDRILSIFNVYYRRRELDPKEDAEPELRPSNCRMVGFCLRAYYRLFNELRTLDYFHDDVFSKDNCKVMLDSSLAPIEYKQRLQDEPPELTGAKRKKQKKKQSKKTKHKK